MAFEQFLNQKKHPDRRSRWRVFTYTVSLSLHGALLVVMIVRSFWHVEELEPRGVVVTLASMRLPPPPPPPAPAQQKATPQPKTKVAEMLRPKRDRLVQPPVERKEEPVAAAPAEEAVASSGDEGGLPGGV
jgi:hypothetical protein